MEMKQKFQEEPPAELFPPCRTDVPLSLCPCPQAGTYLPQSYLVHEEMVVTERLHHVDQLGYYIHRLCGGRDTFGLQRRDHILGTESSWRHRHTLHYTLSSLCVCSLSSRQVC